MIAISIKQPWAWMIANGIKTVENRNWYTEHRGGLLIHAGKNRDDVERDLLIALEDYGIAVPEKELEYGKVIGLVDVVACTKEPKEKFDQFWHVEGNFAWVLRRPRLIDPFRYSGRLKLFEVPWNPRDYHDMIRRADPARWL